MAALRVVNLGVRFLLELGALAAVAYWAATLRASVVMRIVFGIAAPVVVACLWGLFISPRARFSTGRLGESGLGLVVFLVAAAALFDRGQMAIAQAFGIIAVVSCVILYVLPQ